MGLYQGQKQIHVVEDGVGVIKADPQASWLRRQSCASAPWSRRGPRSGRESSNHLLSSPKQARPTAAVLVAAALALPESFGQQPSPQGIGRHLQALWTIEARRVTPGPGRESWDDTSGQSRRANDVRPSHDKRGEVLEWLAIPSLGGQRS